MLHPFSRTELLLGPEAMERLWAARVAVFGVGGVGGYTAEALVRSGIGAVDLIDDDRVCVTNLNRQLHATQKTVGQYKVDVAAQRCADISPDTQVRTYKTFYVPDTAGQFDLTQYDYIVDAIDTVTGKLLLIQNAYAAKTPIISAMGAGNKLDPTAFEVADISKTSICPLARTMRKELRRRGIRHLKVVYSKEEPLIIGDQTIISRIHQDADPIVAREGTPRRQVPGSIAFVPSVMGLILAGEVIKDLAHVHPIRKGRT